MSAPATTNLGQRKIAIPRLPKSDAWQDTIKDRRRVPRACTACRSHKIKCTGEKPRCRHCSTTNRECIYIMTRKDRLKIITQRCHQMAGLLRGLRQSASADEETRIAQILEAVEGEALEVKQNATPSSLDTKHPGSQESNGLLSTHDQNFDIQSLDFLDEDLHNERSRATGFVGKNSEIQWLRSVAAALVEQTDVNGAVPLKNPYSPVCDQVSNFSYWADGELVDVDFFVDAYELPQAETAERLLQCYMDRVHDSFPILPRKTFEDQFRVYFRALQNGKAPRLSSKWQSILNMVFAIGARYSHLIKSHWRADERDHLVYQARARTLGLDECAVASHSDVPQIQRLGLLAFYWLSSGQVSRAWAVIGIALRSAYSLGLHVRNEDPCATVIKRETLIRTWWSLYSLERTLTIVTGRPSIIVDSCCSVPLPVSVPEDRIQEYAGTGAQPHERIVVGAIASPSHPDLAHTKMAFGIPDANSGSYFKAVVQLSIITHNILTSLYSVGTMIRSPVELQQDVSHLSHKLEQWVTTLPPDLSVGDIPAKSPQLFSRERMLLTFQLCSARILLARPYLTKQRQVARDVTEETFARRMADNCAEAARTVVCLFPDLIQPDFIYDQGPWWSIVHHLMQAVSVFLLSLTFTKAAAQVDMTVIHLTKKAIRWLQAFQDPTAKRAHHIALSLLTKVAYRYAIDVSDLWPTSTMYAVQMQDPEAQYETEPSQQGVSCTQTVPSTQIRPAIGSRTAFQAPTAGFGIQAQEAPLGDSEHSYMVR